MIGEAKHAIEPWLLCAPYINGKLGNRLAAEGVSYVDSAGNCHIRTDGFLIAHVEGKKRLRETGTRAPGIKSHQLVFALLAQPDLVEAPVRKVATAAGIGKSAAYELLGGLNRDGLLDYDPGGCGLASGRVLLERWLAAYADVVRPSWLVTRCQPANSNPHALETLIERVCEGRIWAFGGSAAGSRMLAMDRGAETVLHLAQPVPDLLAQLQAVPSANGALTILHTPGELAYQGVKLHLAHPLLIYTELLMATESQGMQPARALRQEYLAAIEPPFD